MYRYTMLGLIATLLVSGTLSIVYGNRELVKPLDSSEALLDREADTFLHDPQYGFQFIRTAPADARYNCHGWTFRFGKRAVSSVEVSSWISSPKYKVVPNKRAFIGDVVIYYRGSEICHSGVVQAISRGGLVLVESKWGTLGRFLHRIDAPKTADHYEVYRRVFPSNFPKSNDNKVMPATTDAASADPR
jgi:hypothetical protein